MRKGQIIAAGVVVAGALMLIPRKAQAKNQPTLTFGYTDDDVEALARMIITETSLKASEAEMAQIVFIAINRARRKSVSPRMVVEPPGKPNAWNAGATYRALYEKADQKPAWEDAIRFVRRVLGGEFVNMGFSSFVHPSAPRFAFPCDDSISAVADGRWAPNHVPGFGTRCIPKWAHNGTVVGKALFT